MRRSPIEVYKLVMRAGLTIALIWAYVSAVFFVEEPRLPFEFGLGAWVVSIGVVLIASDLLVRRALRLQLLSQSTLTNLALLGMTTIASVLALDIGYTMYLNSGSVSFDTGKSRVFDENVWVGELYPRVYYPTVRNFALHKPNVRVSGSHYGNFYNASMKRSSTLVETVLERQRVRININALGFRETSDISETEILALGDSFAFGWGVDEADSWPGLLERQIEKTIYNLAIHDASPRQELELLKYVLRQQGKSLRARKLLWMLYEGNDLEDDYSEVVERRDLPVEVPLLKGTLIEALERLMRTVKRQSVINRLRRGRVTWNSPTAKDSTDPYRVDGVDLAYPLYYSEQLGPRLFSQYYLDLAGKPASYVENHWNHDALISVFQEMQELAAEHEFEVAVIIAPSAARLHGPYFENFPEISEKPHFIDLLKDLSAAANFVTVDLYDLMQPYAGNELLYFRDDDHFNQRGNSLAAALIREELFTSSN